MDLLALSFAIVRRCWELFPLSIGRGKQNSKCYFQTSGPNEATQRAVHAEIGKRVKVILKEICFTRSLERFKFCF